MGLATTHHGAGWSGFAVLLVVWITIAAGAGRIAYFKGRRFWVYFGLGLILGPLVMLVALLMPRPAAVRVAEAAETGPGELPPRWKQFTGIDN